MLYIQYRILSRCIMSKVFVEITAKHDINGSVRPLTIKWEDGRVFEVDRVLDVRQAPSLKGGGLGYVQSIIMQSIER